MHCPKCNEECAVRTDGLNTTGIVLLIVLILFCFPLFWIPLVVDGCKKHVCVKCGTPLD